MSEAVSRRKAPSRREAVGGIAAGAAVLAAPAIAAPTSGPIILDDVSGLNATPVARHLRPPVGEGLVETLRRELKAAAAEGRPVCVGGARHSMGGQSLARDGAAITFDRGVCRPDADGRTYHAGAGARWRDVIATLDPLDRAPMVTQANNDFTLGGAFSVNVHGWAAPLGPMGSTVRSIRLLTADGQLVRCSREVEPDLFALAMGGYGLLGIIVDLEVETAPNVRLKPSYEKTAAAGFGPRFAKALHEPGVVMGYGRLSVSRRDFFEEAMMTVFRPVDGDPERLSGKGDPMAGVVRELYRAQIGSEFWKTLRWRAETRLKPSLDNKVFTRNALINSSVDELAGRDRRRTDILHEYFLPPEGLDGFLAACRGIIPKSGLDLLNVTLRYVAADRTSVMAFAPTDRVAAVMSFSQPLTQKADEAMKPVTQALIDAALASGGSFYLPYRLHARPDQLARAYPGLSRFVAEKRRLDPGGLFRNTMWDRYFAGVA